jgi:mono/diheme cytochrome c family protein
MPQKSQPMAHSGSWQASAVVMLAMLLGGAILIPNSSAHTKTTAVTWAGDVAPILTTRCVGCHGGGGASHVRLDTYADAKLHARSIREEVLAGRMPPWPAARGFGDFSNDRSLSPTELELLVAWSDGDTPIGIAAPSAQASTPRVRPDLEVQLPAPLIDHALRGRVEVAVGNRTAAWVSGWSLRPISAADVQRVQISVVGGEPLGSWVPGDPFVSFPRGVAERLPAQARVAIDYQFRKTAATRGPEAVLELAIRRTVQHPLRHRLLSCGASTIPMNTNALAVTPVAGGAGDWLEVVANPPDGRVIPLVAIREFDPSYPLTYRFRNPVTLPHGTVVHVRASSPDCHADLEVTVPTTAVEGARPQ